MSRIRSVHPGLWTDERFMEVSPLARLLFIGIWNECDDKGSFEWSPIKLKARLLPVDNCDVVALLAELESTGSVIRYEMSGRKFGAVRNFTRYQRPKKPNSTYPQTDEVRNFCAGEQAQVPNQFPTGTEIDPQREEGGGKREDGFDDDDARASAAADHREPDWPSDLIDLTQAVCRAAGIRHAEPGPILAQQKLVRGWVDDGFDPVEDIQPGISAGLSRAHRDGETINSLRYFDRDIRQQRARREAGIHGQSNSSSGHGRTIDAALDFVAGR